ncbi:MAG: hypothetical protein KDI79_20120 [Anaerolineae bacterium]|nr:hypothetical protein [Anaerolineae bacterium]
MAKKREVTYFVVIENLKLSHKLTIGPVELEPLTQEKFQELIDKVNIGLDKKSYYFAEEKDRETFKQLQMQPVLSQFTPKAHAALASTRLFVRGAANDFVIAHKRFQDVLHLLRFCGGFVYKKGSKANAYIGLRGELYWGYRAYLTFSDEAEWGFGQHRVGYLFPFDLTQKRLELFRKNELDTFSAVFSKPLNEQTDIEKRLISSITWVSRSTFELSESEQFILLCIALENLLGGDIKKSITKTLTERLALLLEDEHDKRIEIANQTLEIFRIRGEVVHTGQPNDASKLLEQLPLAFEYINRAIVKTARLMKELKWNEISDFTSYLTELKVA